MYALCVRLLGKCQVNDEGVDDASPPHIISSPWERAWGCYGASPWKCPIYKSWRCFDEEREEQEGNPKENARPSGRRTTFITNSYSNHPHS